jgi:hypothetical protein
VGEEAHRPPRDRPLAGTPRRTEAPDQAHLDGVEADIAGRLGKRPESVCQWEQIREGRLNPPHR